MNWTETLTPAAERMKQDWALLDGVALGTQNGSAIVPLDPRTFANGDFVSVWAALNICIRRNSRRKMATAVFQPKQVIRLATDMMLKQIGVVKAPVKEAKRYSPYTSTARNRARIAAVEFDADLMTPTDKVDGRTTVGVTNIEDQSDNRDKEMASVE
jgi:hypothetical protein